MNSLIDCYEQIAMASGSMLAAARSRDWDGLVAAERECAASVVRLKSAQECAQPLDAVARRRKVAIIRSVLANDAEIRALTQPWLARLQELLTAATTRRAELEAVCR